MSVTAILGASLSNENKIRLRWRKAPRREPAAGRRLASNPLAVLLTALESLPNLIGNKKAIRGNLAPGRGFHCRKQLRQSVARRGPLLRMHERRLDVTILLRKQAVGLDCGLDSIKFVPKDHHTNIHEEEPK